MKLAGINDEVMEVFRITKLDTVFDIYMDEAGALQAFRGTASHRKPHARRSG